MSDRETVMSTPVESDKRDRVGIMSPPAWRWYVGGLDVCGGERDYSNGGFRKQQRRIGSQRMVCLMSFPGDS